MPREVLLLLTPLLALAAAALTQAASYRLRRSLTRSYLAALLGGTVCVGALSFSLRGANGVEDLALGLANLGTFLGLWLCFVAVVGLGVSLRLRVLNLLLKNGRPLSEAKISERFEGDMLVRRRLDRLISGGHVLEREGLLISAGTWLTRVALFNTLVKHFLTGRTSEFQETQARKCDAARPR